MNSWAFYVSERVSCLVKRVWAGLAFFVWNFIWTCGLWNCGWMDNNQVLICGHRDDFEITAGRDWQTNLQIFLLFKFQLLALCLITGTKFAFFLGVFLLQFTPNNAPRELFARETMVHRASATFVEFLPEFKHSNNKEKRQRWFFDNFWICVFVHPSLQRFLEKEQRRKKGQS